MPKYVLITIDKRATEWDIYGHYGVGQNTLIGRADNRIEALLLAHAYRLPVMVGTSHDGMQAEVLWKLLKEDKE